MNETRIYADAFETTFANTKEMLEFLAERAKASQWIRKPTRMLRLVPLEKEAETIEKACTKQLEGIVEDTEKNTQLVLKINGEVYPVRDCAMHTILKRAGVSGTGLRKLEKATYAKVINYCLKVARGDALIKIADGKVSAVHGGDEHDYCVLDMEAVFSMTCDYLKAHFSGSAYLEGSGTYDHSIAYMLISQFVFVLQLISLVSDLLKKFRYFNIKHICNLIEYRYRKALITSSSFNFR